VDCSGRKSREQELHFPTVPLHVATLTADLMSGGPVKLLLAFSATHIDVYDLSTTEWVQTINLKSTKPLQSHASNSSLLCLSSALDLPLLVHIVPANRRDLLLRVTGDPAKPFVVNSAAGAAHRLIQSAAGAVIDRPAKQVRPDQFSCGERPYE
jgi:serine/threonine-protein kinase MRCK